MLCEGEREREILIGIIRLLNSYNVICETGVRKVKY